MIKDREAKYDSTTPDEYDKYNSGVIDFIIGDRDQTTGAIVTQGFKDEYNVLISRYALQLFQAEDVHLKPNEGIENYQDVYGNKLYIINPQYHAYYLKMRRWNKQGRPEDTIWLKIKNL